MIFTKNEQTALKNIINICIEQYETSGGDIDYAGFEEDSFSILAEIKKKLGGWAKSEAVGKWYLIEYEYLDCSNCGHQHYTGCESTAEAKEKLQNGEVPNYCSHCGAMMNGDTQ